MTNEEELMLLEFFKQATASLEHIQVEDSVDSLSNVRQILLTKQTECLASTVDAMMRRSQTVTPSAAYSLASLQSALSGLNDSTKAHALPVQHAMEVMNDAARLAFCRLVIQSESIKDNDKKERDLIVSSVKDSDILEFCGLCLAAVRLPLVQDHVRQGTPLGDVLSDSTLVPGMAPQDRLEGIQRLFLRALGYDPDYAMAELKRMFIETTTNTPNEGNGPNNQLVVSTFQSMIQEMNEFLVDMSALTPTDGPSLALSEDTTTRVVSVTYSEKLIDAATGEEILTFSDNGAPRLETISQETDVREAQASLEEPREQSRNEMHVARQTAQLHNEILKELLAMPADERCAKLQLAKEAVDQVLSTAVLIPEMSERISFMTTLDSTTQRLMAMYKIWNGMLAENGGIVPDLVE